MVVVPMMILVMMRLVPIAARRVRLRSALVMVFMVISIGRALQVVCHSRV
jgi:hypothetical protein